jgi:hypothetical protein
MIFLSSINKSYVIITASITLFYLHKEVYMFILRHLMLLSTTVLTACNSGTSSSDIQAAQVENGSGANTYYISYTATGCQTISSNGGTCQVAVTYRGSGNYSNQKLQLNNLTGYSSNISTNCQPPSASSNNTCNFVITASGPNTRQTPAIALGSTNASINFVVGQ